MLKFYFHDGVRTAAAESLPCLLECAKIRGPQYVQEMWSYICPELLKAIEAEPETDVLAEHFNSLARCVELLGMGCLDDAQMGELVKIMLKTFQVSSRMETALPFHVQLVLSMRQRYHFTSDPSSHPFRRSTLSARASGTTSARTRTTTLTWRSSWRRRTMRTCTSCPSWATSSTPSSLPTRTP